MELLSSRPFWPIKDGLLASFPPLDSDVRCDVAIVGAGITGALMAWLLTDAGFAVVVLDRREAAHGSTAGSTALLQYEIDLPLQRLAQRIGLTRARRAYGDCLRAVQGIRRLVTSLRIDCGFTSRASLQLAQKSAHVPALRRELTARAAAGFNVTWWSRRDLARRSSLPHAAALYSASPQAAQVDAYALAYGLLTAAQRRGAAVHDRTAVVSHRRTSRGVDLRTDRGTRVRARWLVVASGYEAGPFLPEAVTSLRSTYALATEPVAQFTGWPEGRPVMWETGDPYLYLRTTEDRRVIIGGYDEPWHNAPMRDRLLPRKTRTLHRRLGQLFPENRFEIATAWAGTFGTTPDGLPYIGEHLGLPHTWFALGYGGNGITYSLLAAKLFRERLLKGRARGADLYGFGRAA